MDTSALTIRIADPADAAALLHVIHQAFAARPAVDPPAEALTDEVADIERALTDGFGVVVEREGHIIAGLLVDIVDGTATLRRVSVLPSASGQGVARSLVEGALTVAADLGARRASLFARQEFPQLVEWWRDHGFDVIAPEPHGFRMGRDLPVVVDVPTADDMARLGRRLAGVLRKGDVIVATGDLGAGKTTLTQGIGAGLDVEGPIISPTFVISRVHPPRGEGPGLVHVDAYRLGDPSELADIDLDASLPESVTLVEWGHGLAEWLADDRLEIDIVRGVQSDERTVYLTGFGPRWAGALDVLRENP
jgi:tRNA threonylcarbamoyladenosine biosynthesis protein TsaE